MPACFPVTINIPPSLDRLMMYAQESIHDVTGVNLELLGFANREQPGVLEQQRKQAGMTILSTWFDAFKLFRKEQGRIVLYMIQHYVPENTLVRVVGEEGSQYVPLVKTPGTVKFDVIVDESPQSPNQQERTFLMMTEILPALANYGFMPPIEAVDYTPLPSKLKEAFKKAALEGPQIPEEVQEQIAEGQKQIEKLTAENQKLKDKRQEQQVNQEIKVAELQLKKEEHEMEMAFKREEAEADLILEQKKNENQIQLEREKAEAQIAIEKMKVEAQIALKAAELEQDVELEREKAASNVQIKKAELEEKAKEREFSVDNITEKVKQKPRKITVERDENDMITNIFVQEVAESKGDK